MLRDLEFYPQDLLSRRPFKVQLAQPNKVITQNINNVSSPSLSDVKINGLPQFEFEVPYMVKVKSVDGNPELYIKNPDLIAIKEEKLIKLTWYDNKVNWFRVIDINKTDGEDKTTVKITASSLESELRKTNISIEGTGIDATQYFTQALEQTAWKLGYVSDKLSNTFRTFDGSEKQTRYEAVQKGLETFGAIADFDGETRTISLLTIDELRVNRGVVLKRENFANSIEINSTSEDIVTRLYATGNESLTIEKANPTGMRYIEDFSYFLYPFKRDENKNIIEHSYFMSDDLSHALSDLIELQKIYEPQIKQHQDELNQAYSDLSKAMLEKAELDNQLITVQSLLDTAKATGDKPLIAQREQEVASKQAEVTAKQETVDNINQSIEAISKEMDRIQEMISTSSFTPELREELSLFVYEKDFNDDRYIDAESLYDATVKEFEKFQKPTQTFTVDMASFLNSIQGKRFEGKLKIGEEVTIRSEKFDTSYTSIILGIEGDLEDGHYRIQVSDNMDDIDSMDRLASIIYKAESSSTVLENNKYKWDSITTVKDEVTNWRDKEINTVDNRIIAGANESITIDNRGMMVRNPDFPNEVIIIQSGVVALSRDGGKTWSTSITPKGVIADTLIGKILAGNNLIITNDAGDFVIDNTGMTINMDSIRIMSGESGKPENVIESWNKLLLTYQEIASDSMVNEYEKGQLTKQWTSIVDIHSSMIASFEKGWKQRPVPEPDPEKPTPDPEMPKEYNDYIEAYEALNKYLNVTKQSDGFALLDPENKKITTVIDPEEFKTVFTNYEKTKQALESIISFSFTSSQIIMLETGIALQYVKNGNIVTALNLSEEGIRIDGKLLEINSETEFNANLTMNAGVIRGKDDGIVIDLNTGKITLNTKVEIGLGSNLVTDDDLEPLKGQIVATLTNDYETIFTDGNGSGGWYTLATTDMNVYRDGNLDNNNWTFSIEKNDNIVAGIYKNQAYVTSIKGDSETLVVVATRGREVLKKEFRLKKFKSSEFNMSRGMEIIDGVHKSIFGEWIPTQLTASGRTLKKGATAPVPYAGRYKVYESTNGGVDYLLQYTSGSDEVVLRYVPTPNVITHIKVQFYLAGNTLNLIDEQILPIINDQEKTYTHTAYSWSKDGKEDFTVLYPNFNLEHFTRQLMDSSNNLLWGQLGTATDTARFESLSTEKTRVVNAIKFTQSKKGQSGWRSPAGNKGGSIPWNGKDNITLSVDVKNNYETPLNLILQIGQSVNEDQSAPIYKTMSISVQPNTGWQRISATFKPNDGIKYFWNYVYTSNQSVIADWMMKAFKVEYGDSATPWMPADSEVMNSDYPMFVGNQTSSRYLQSTNPDDYKWVLFRGEDGKASSSYKAFAWSPDGKNRFTTVYPNPNWLDNSTWNYGIGSWKILEENDPYWEIIEPEDDKFRSHILHGKPTTLATQQVSQLPHPIEVKTGEVYTLSFDYRDKNWTSNINMMLLRVFPAEDTTNSQANSLQNIAIDNNKLGIKGEVTEFTRFNVTFTVTADGFLDVIPYDNDTTGNHETWYRELKVEAGEQATIWIPNEPEYGDNWMDSTPKYIGYSDIDSQSPSDYEWTLNVEYVQIGSESGLAGKASNKDLADVSEVANGALTRAENSVLNEDYTSWLEHDYQSTIDTIRDVSAQNQEDIKNVDDRTTIMEGFYGEMKVKWNFIDESFTFSEEGMFISNAQSKMAIQVTSDKIVFWDNNVDVAFITGEVLNIQKGVFLESATIGNHLITKFSDESPVTIIRYVGGIT